MKKSFKKLASVVLAGVMVLMCCSCTADKNSETNSELYGGEVVVGITQEPSIFDPHTVVAAGDKEILFNIFEGLYKFDSEGNLNPALATDVEISDSADKYTFTIREGVKFHNGSDMTIDDVVYSINRAAGLLDGQEAALVAELDCVESVTADGNQVIVNLDAPNSELLSFFTTAIVPADVADLNDTPIGTGPFMFDSYTVGQNVVIVKNENYWGEGAPYLDKVTFQICADLDAGFLELQNGTIDIFPYLTSDKASQLDPNSFTVLKKGSDMVQIFALNNAVAPFDDVRVRQAINYAVNREDVIALTMDGDGLPLTTAMSPVIGEAYDTSLDGTYDFDLERAQELMAEAGYADGFDMTITVPSNYLIHVNTGIVIAEQLSAIGINAEIVQVDWATWLEDTYAGRNFDSTIIALTSVYAPYDVLTRYVSTADNNFISYNNPDFDAVFTQIPLTADADQRIEMYHEALGYITADAASCYIQDPYNIVAVNNRVTGYEMYSMYVQDMSTVHLAQ